jgi:hypothetical protein
VKKQDVAADLRTLLAKLHRPAAQILDEPFGFQTQSGLRLRLSIDVMGVSILSQLGPGKPNPSSVRVRVNRPECDFSIGR